MAFFIKLALWALAFVPLVINSSVFFPFIFGKTILIRFIIALVSVLFTVHLIADERFRTEIYGKAKRVIRSPLFITTSAFMALFAISTFFAINPFRAFFGDVERGEGLLGFLYFYAFFVYSLFLFEKKDWVLFFKLNLITGLFLFTKQLFELCPTSEAGATVCNWGARPGAFTGNPAFLGGYFLFVIFAAMIAFYYSKKEPIWRAFSMAMLPIATIGLLITQTRSAMLGLVVGLVALVVYGFSHGKRIVFYKKISLRTASLYFLAVMVLIGGVFLATKTNSFWKSVPGFNRVAEFTLQDFTVQTRLISLGVSANAIDPAQNGVQKFLIGWGPENFSIAYNQYYNPDYYHLEHTWFDRAHDKLMDVAVMNGLLGFLAYMGIWISAVWLVFRKKEFSFDMMAVLFFAVSFFINLLFLFDQISTIIPFFAFAGFAVFATMLETKESGVANAVSKKKTHGDEVLERIDYISYGATIVAAILFVWGFIFWTLVPMSQMNSYLGAISKSDVTAIIQQPDVIFEPYTFVQQDIRGHFLSAATANYENPQLKPMVDLAIAKMEELIEKEPSNPRYLLMLGGAYERIGKADGSMEYIKKAEALYQKATILAPMRQDVIYVLSLNYAYQGRSEEGIALLRKSLETDTLSPETHYYLAMLLLGDGQGYEEALKEMEIAMQSPVFSTTKNIMARDFYRTLLRQTYQARDKKAFIVAAKRLGSLDEEQGADIQRMVEYVEKGIWPTVNFQ
ncbi:MAG: hypothetical protein ACD_81C00089G0021 [uncultured bacterium]|uniref:O-antigen ligase-related domain-containing protein n=1 Tax=Candidatus Wolfebacteria bacterium GW2011_GWE2_44_13 TaxID=1619017 RepID=A0A0G1K6P8_9BACT|nr:MAG: hypothetical protein ACD_81C00089G0021 [uncultured bacterium]KKT43534.1 MAG: hypothetical protein UW32_C0001G0126 [Candidatus Wolfebacteria bacterium GW2011_GWE2_44_13]